VYFVECELCKLDRWNPPRTLRSPTPYKRRSCIFLRDGHGFGFSYTLPISHVAEDEAELAAIVDATTFLTP